MILTILVKTIVNTNTVILTTLFSLSVACLYYEENCFTMVANAPAISQIVSVLLTLDSIMRRNIIRTVCVALCLCIVLHSSFDDLVHPY